MNIPFGSTVCATSFAVSDISPAGDVTRPTISRVRTPARTLTVVVSRVTTICGSMIWIDGAATATLGLTGSGLVSSLATLAL